MTTVEVQLISATWCKRCQTIKPEVASLCTLTGIGMTIIDYDEMEETDPVKNAIKSLPTIRLKLVTGWQTYTAATIDDFKADILVQSIGNSDF